MMPVTSRRADRRASGRRIRPRRRRPPRPRARRRAERGRRSSGRSAPRPARSACTDQVGAAGLGREAAWRARGRAPAEGRPRRARRGEGRRSRAGPLAHVMCPTRRAAPRRAPRGGGSGRCPAGAACARGQHAHQRQRARERGHAVSVCPPPPAWAGASGAPAGARRGPFPLAAQSAIARRSASTRRSGPAPAAPASRVVGQRRSGWPTREVGLPAALRLRRCARSPGGRGAGPTAGTAGRPTPAAAGAARARSTQGDRSATRRDPGGVAGGEEHRDLGAQRVRHQVDRRVPLQERARRRRRAPPGWCAAAAGSPKPGGRGRSRGPRVRQGGRQGAPPP